MKVVKKYSSNDFKGFDWLDFDYLPGSKGFKFEVYFKEPKDLVSKSILIFYSLFRSFLDDVLITTFGQDGEWGNFCLDTWDIENDRYDYSPHNKKEPTASYLSMLNDSGIEPEYNGYCKCINWDKFLYVMFHCVAQHTAPYSMMFYEPKNEFVFYFHHSGSFGIYYKDLNSSIKKVIRKVQEENLEIKNTNDKRVSSIAM
ncbi:hypothetical protein [Fulvivirga ligni]|uniref:hypothetical protein n=1 Tax=Fulvivirga ligni TaxID=2904246 RepID=UPI001F167FF8|nr:hypothetical protein [Fulvivirga ligni]UII22647.1 hypothetical protein LVD16_05330 [Fulvivirga ligni]